MSLGPIDPRGMIVDLLRSAYSTRMRFGPDDEQVVTVRWFECAAEAEPLPFPTVFNSRIWDDPSTLHPTGGQPPPVGDSALGEVVGDPRPWSNGFNWWGFLGQQPVGPRGKYLVGLDQGERFDCEPTCFDVVASERMQATASYAVSWTGCRLLTQGPCRTAPCCFALYPTSADGQLDGSKYIVGGNVADGLWEQLEYVPPAGGGPAAPPFVYFQGPMEPYVWPDQLWRVKAVCGGGGALSETAGFRLRCSDGHGVGLMPIGAGSICDPGFFPISWRVETYGCFVLPVSATERMQADATYSVGPIPPPIEDDPMIPYTFAVGSGIVANTLAADNANLSLVTQLRPSGTDQGGNDVSAALRLVPFGSIVTVRSQTGGGYALYFVLYSDPSPSGAVLTVRYLGGETAVTDPVSFSWSRVDLATAWRNLLSLPYVPNTTLDVYRPFGAASPTYTTVPCRNFPSVLEARPFGSADLNYSDVVLVGPTEDIRDGGARALGVDSISYADGDRVVIPAGSGNTSFVVVWVEVVDRGLATEHKRVYLLRDLASWPGP